MAGGAANEALKERITRLENFVGVPEDDEAVSLSVSTEQHAIELVDLRKILDDFMTETNARVNNIIEDVMSLTDVVKINLKSLEDEVALVKKVDTAMALVSLSQCQGQGGGGWSRAPLLENRDAL
ncbi:hypothetical protein F0562_025476 [Nyssa sinensis]|uniref:Uncharacterized protein n=1 Tax=Nyssa sinensis TaxID=561372 RepID=A0A5J5B858_9ASTE|nr:hypothetical protein F0562_025476 [Nyssa sinensis]